MWKNVILTIGAASRIVFELGFPVVCWILWGWHVGLAVTLWYILWSWMGLSVIRWQLKEAQDKEIKTAASVFRSVLLDKVKELDKEKKDNEKK